MRTGIQAVLSALSDANGAPERDASRRRTGICIACDVSVFGPFELAAEVSRSCARAPAWL